MRSTSTPTADIRMRRWGARASTVLGVIADQPRLWLPGALAWLATIGWIPLVVTLVPPPTAGELTFLGPRFYTSGLWPLNLVLLAGSVVAVAVLLLLLAALGNAVLLAVAQRRRPAGRDVLALLVPYLIACVPVAFAMLALGVALIAIGPSEFNRPQADPGPVVRTAGRLAPLLVFTAIVVVGAGTFAGLAGRGAVVTHSVAAGITAVPGLARRAGRAGALHLAVTVSVAVAYLAPRHDPDASPVGAHRRAHRDRGGDRPRDHPAAGRLRGDLALPRPRWRRRPRVGLDDRDAAARGRDDRGGVGSTAGAADRPMSPDLSLATQIDLALRLALGLVLGAIIGFERESHGQPAGFRTHSLVATGSALFTIVSAYGFGGDLADPTRIAAQIVTGIGFIGAGTILQYRGQVRGLTTAASLWSVAAIGMAAGAGMWIISLVATAMIVVILIVFDRIEDFARRRLDLPPEGYKLTGDSPEGKSEDHQ